MSYEFETDDGAWAEDQFRARALRTVDFGESELNRRARQLARRLGDQERVPITCASSCYMRPQRRRIVGAIWRLLHEQSSRRVVTATLTPERWRCRPGVLLDRGFKARLAALRTMLNSLGAPGADGFLIAFLHGDFFAPTELFEPHLHILATDGMIEVLDSVRGRPWARPLSGPRHPLDTINPPLVMSRRSLGNMPLPLSYLLKSFWSVRKGLGMKAIGHGRMRRIPEPHHSEVLLFLDQHRLEDMSLLMGVRVGKNGLIQKS